MVLRSLCLCEVGIVFFVLIVIRFLDLLIVLFAIFVCAGSANRFFVFTFCILSVLLS